MKSVSSGTGITPIIKDLEVNINKLKSDLKNLKPNKASGPDGISYRSLAVAGSSASDGLLMVFHYSMASSSFPDTWKLAKVHAIHKKGSQADVYNYRQSRYLVFPANSLKARFTA